ncbi:MAG: ATP-dependent RNA helicase HrpA, partial [Phycisphaerales bacterium]
VVDTGLVRLSRYSTRTKTQRLPIEPISQASAAQRAGRCGRLGPGVCIRLYSEELLAAAPAFTEPEILRTNLANVILQMKALGLGEPERFPFLESPDPRLIQDGYDTLAELGAVRETSAGEWALTDLGRSMARLPVDPRIARIVLAGVAEGCAREVLVIAAALSVQDPRERPFDLAQQADEAHAPFRDPDSDFLSFLRLWEWFGEQARAMGGSRLRKLCAAKHLSYVRLREWQDVHRQLSEMLDGLPQDSARPSGRARERPPTVRGWKGGGANEPTFEQIHCALLAGLLSSIGEKHDHFEYRGARSSRFSIFPGSGLFRNAPKWAMASELVRTTRLYARCCARIRPEWVERVGAHLLKRVHSDPFYDDSSQRVLAHERVTILGLELATKRIAHYGPVNPAEARAIFIQHALVEQAAGTGVDGEDARGLRTPGRFLAHNAEVLARVRMMEHKLRRSDILAGPIKRFEFYDQRLGKDVYSGQTFEKWREEAERIHPRILFMSEEDATAARPDADALAQFPDHLESAGSTLGLRYRAEPGHEADGVTAVVPVEALNRVDETRAEYLVPGLLVEKIDALIRTLPKALRTAFVPVGQYAALCAQELAASRAPLMESVAQVLSGIADVPIRPEDFRVTDLPDHLRMNYAVVDRSGRELAAGRDLGPIRRSLAVTIDAAMARVPDPAYNREGLHAWDFGDLPEEAVVTDRHITARGRPTLVDDGDSVSLKLMASPRAAVETHRLGVLRLFTLAARRELERAVRALPDLNRMALLFGTLGTGADLRRQLIDRTAERVFMSDGAEIRQHAEFQARLLEGERRIGEAMTQTGRVVLLTLDTAQRALRTIEDARNPSIIPGVADAREHLARLVFRGFLARVPPAALEEYPRYLNAIDLRVRRLIAKGAAAAPRDQELMLLAAHWWSRYVRQRVVNDERREPDAELETLRWMIEEYRVSLFAQELGTVSPISVQRLERQWAKVRQS